MAAFGRPGAPAVTIAALLGALAPDLSLYLLAGWQLGVRGTPAQAVFREMYYSDAWQAVFAVDNSVPLWAAGLALALWRRSRWGVAFAGAGLLHLALDLPLHNEDARRHFWPLTDWVFRSPVSYWDGARFGGVVGPIEAAATLGLCVWLWTRYTRPPTRVAIAALAMAEAAPFVMWGLILGG